jgi:hypothetical protein
MSLSSSHPFFLFSCFSRANGNKLLCHPILRVASIAPFLSFHSLCIWIIERKRPKLTQEYPMKRRGSELPVTPQTRNSMTSKIHT